MTIRKVEIERFSVTSSKPFEEFVKAIQVTRTFNGLESAVHRGLGRTGLMMFMKFDHGESLRKETGVNRETNLDPDHISYDLL